MKDAIKLPHPDFLAEGRCCIQYTDPVTGKVLEEIKGKNHVFGDQFIGLTDFAAPLNADLLLCTGGTPIDQDIPIVPGYPIGYGRVETDGAGLFRGAYRVADSYVYKASRTKINNKYVYDFLPTQALGDVRFVGLTGAVAANAAFSGAHATAKASWKHPATISCRSSEKVYDCDTGVYYYLVTSWSYADGNSSNGHIHSVKVRWADSFFSHAENEVDITALLNLGKSASSFINAKLFLDSETKALYLLLSRIPFGETEQSHTVFALSSDLSSVTGQWTIDSAPEGLNYGGYRNGKLYYCANDSTNNYAGYILNVIDLESGTATSTQEAGDAALSHNRFSLSTTFGAHIYKNYLWYGARNLENLGTHGVDFFLWTAPMLDLDDDGALVSALSPCYNITNNRYDYTGYYRAGPTPIGLFRKQWGVYHYDAANTATYNTAYLPFAFTCYKLPDNAPTRPEGSGMTVTYELDITW